MSVTIIESAKPEKKKETYSVALVCVNCDWAYDLKFDRGETVKKYFKDPKAHKCPKCDCIPIEL